MPMGGPQAHGNSKCLLATALHALATISRSASTERGTDTRAGS